MISVSVSETLATPTIRHPQSHTRAFVGIASHCAQGFSEGCKVLCVRAWHETRAERRERLWAAAGDCGGGVDAVVSSLCNIPTIRSRLVIPAQSKHLRHTKAHASFRHPPRRREQSEATVVNVSANRLTTVAATA